MDLPTTLSSNTLASSSKISELLKIPWSSEKLVGSHWSSTLTFSLGTPKLDALEPRGLSFPVTDNGVFSSAIDEIGLQRTSHEHSVLSSHHSEQTNLATAGNWLGFDDSQINSSKLPTEVVAKHGGYNGTVEFQLPEEESLISVDSLTPQLSTLMPTGNSSKNDFLFSKEHVDVAENLAAISAVIKDKRTIVGSECMPFECGPYEQTDPEIPYRNIQVQPSPPQFQPLHMNHGRPLFHPLDSHPAHISLQEFMGPESLFNHDTPANSQFPANIIRPLFHNPNSGVAAYDLHAHRSILHPMQMPDNRTQLLSDFPRGAPVPYPGNQTIGFIQDRNPMQGFPFGPHQPNIGSLGMSVPGRNFSFFI